MGARVVFWKKYLRCHQRESHIGSADRKFQKVYANQVKNSLRVAIYVDRRSAQSIPQNICGEGLVGLAALLLFMGTVFAAKVSSPYREIAFSILLAWTATSIFSSHFSTFPEGRLIFFWLEPCWRRRFFARP